MKQRIYMKSELLELIKKKESYGGNYNILARDKPERNRKLTDMTLGQLIGYQEKNKSKAAGAYQFKPNTIRMLMRNMGLKNSDRFTPALQEKMGDKLLEYRGFSSYKRGEMPAEEFALKLAQEWASFPSIVNEKYVNPVGGAVRNLEENKSYYHEDKGTNKSLFSPEDYQGYKNMLYKNSSFKPEYPTQTQAETTRVQGYADGFKPALIESTIEKPGFFESLFK